MFDLVNLILSHVHDLGLALRANFEVYMFFSKVNLLEK